MRSRLSSISAGVTESPGRFSARRLSSAAAGTRAACTRLCVTADGELIHNGVSSGTGHTLSRPAKGSRMIPLTNEDNAELGSPGRIATVASRELIPSMNPRLVYSLTSSSTIAFSAPYDVSGRSAMSSGTTRGSAPPKTATLLANTKRGAFRNWRQASSSPRDPSTLTCIPASKSASAWPLRTAAR